MLREAVKFTKNVLAPINDVGDRVGAKWDAGKVTMPPGFKDAFNKFREGGWMNATVDPEFGGMGLPHTIAEVLIASTVAFSLSAMLTRGSAALIESFGTDELKATYCEKMYSGQWAGTMCLSEPQAGSDVGATKTTATKVDGQDYYMLEGTKCWITSGQHDLTENIIHLVLARRPEAPAGTAGISLFVVPRERITATGGLEPNDVFCASIEHKLGIHGSPTCVLKFGENGNCRGWLVGDLEKGMKYMFQMMNDARLEVGVQGQAVGALSYFHALNYAYQRAQGRDLKDFANYEAPQVAIIKHPDVRRMLMFMKSVTEGMRSLLFETTLYGDLRHHHADPAERQKYDNYMALLTPICKAYCSDMGFRVAETGVQVLGGVGYTKDFPLEQALRDAKTASIYEGTNGIQALDLLVRKVGKGGGILYMTYLNNEINDFLGKVESHARLADMGNMLAGARNALNDVTMKFAELGVDVYPVYNATPYLKMFGHVVIGKQLLHQAVVADAKLQALAAANNATEEKAFKAFCRSNAEASFYFDKIQAARFFITQVMPEVYAIKESIFSMDKSGLYANLPAYADA